ncbi:hypothetical protein [Neoaquamicrobium sediminum]|uniref:Uncharacterized protein n=1 Tax=Neoaquamicrobium sediminum TaxID=1849104 RepID=A0ABV3WV26_9HYPH
MNLATRLSKLEEMTLGSQSIVSRVVRIVAPAGWDGDANALLRQSGHAVSPEGRDIVITRLIVTPEGQPPSQIAPRILSVSGGA